MRQPGSDKVPGERLTRYRAMRDFATTPEPSGAEAKRDKGDALAFTVQRHAARRLHYDFRLELGGVLRSWAVPKGPSLDPGERRLAVETEDHPLEYGDFEGVIPARQYGAGEVVLWDRGTWSSISPDPAAALAKGKLKFRLDGDKLQGAWTLVRMRGKADEDDGPRNWLLIKEDDEEARSGDAAEITLTAPGSVKRVREKALHGTAGSGEQRVGKRSAASPVTGKGKSSGSERSPRREGDKAAAVALPAFVAPQLASLVAEVPPGEGWVYEIKYDGYRLMSRLRSGKATLFTRNGHDWTSKLPQLAKALGALKLDDSWLDGEIVVNGDDGLPDFQALQNAFESRATAEIVYYVFDAPWLDGRELTELPLVERKRLLAEALAGREAGIVGFSEHFAEGAGEALEQACRLGLEGLIGKRADARYVSGRSRSWIKLKCRPRQEFVIGGYTEPGGARKGFGALLVGLYDDAGELNYAGKVGTGFDQATLTRLASRLSALEREESPFARKPRGAGQRWVKPTLVAEVEYAGWTRGGLLRQAAYAGLREDKPARTVHDEKPLLVGEESDVDKNKIDEPEVREPKIKEPEIKEPDIQEPDTGEPDVEEPPKPRKPRKPTKSGKPSAADEAAVAKKTAVSGKAAVSGKSGRASATATRGANSGKTAPVRVAGINISNADRVVWPDAGLTKADLARYYEAVGDWLLPHIENRPLSLLRCPDGSAAECFFQRHMGQERPADVESFIWEGSSPSRRSYLYVTSLEGVIGMVQRGAIEFHTWGSTMPRADRPDRMTIDLDPGPELGWDRVVEAARLVHGLLGELGLASFVKTTGGKGLHVVVPLRRGAEWDDVKRFSKAVAVHLARILPDRFTANMAKNRRVGRIFVDYLRNDASATAICAYAARARPGAPVSTPIAWDELTPELKPADFSIATVPERLARLREDPWRDYAKKRFTLTRAMWEALGEAAPASARSNRQRRAGSEENDTEL